MNVELHLGTKLQSGTKLQIKDEVHSNNEISAHDRNIELPDREENNGSKFESPIKENIVKPKLSKYVKRRHLATQNIGDKEARIMTRNKLRSDTCPLSMHEPK